VSRRGGQVWSKSGTRSSPRWSKGEIKKQRKEGCWRAQLKKGICFAGDKRGGIYPDLGRKKKGKIKGDLVIAETRSRSF